MRNGSQRRRAAARSRAKVGFAPNKPYTNFVLSWECKNLKPTEYDSGVHFRAELPKAPAHWPKKFQVNLKTDQEGNLTSVKEAASTGLYKKGQWNKFKLTVTGTTAEFEINDKPAWKTDKIDTPTGYIGLQSEVTLGGQFEFRNIKIKELPYQHCVLCRERSARSTQRITPISRLKPP